MPYSTKLRCLLRMPSFKSKAKGPTKRYRFDARLNENQRRLIQRAADLEGKTLTDFVLRSAETAAERTIQERELLVLTARESQFMVDLLLNPPPPGKVLRAAARRYRSMPKT